MFSLPHSLLALVFALSLSGCFGKKTFVTSETHKTNQTANSLPAPAPITAKPVNNAPVAQADSFTLDQYTQTTGKLFATDVDSVGLTYSLVSTGSKGKATLTDASSGTFVYVPNRGAYGSDSFTFVASDGVTNSAPATIQITINLLPDNFDLRIFGPLRVYPGHGLYLFYSGVRTGGAPGNLYVNVSGLPAGVTASFPDMERTCCGNQAGGYFLWNVDQEFYTSVKLAIPQTLPPGHYTASITARSSGVSLETPFTFTVMVSPAPIQKNPYTVFADAPGLAQYNQQMITHGRNQLCNKEQIELSGLWEGNAWYYDGTRVAYQIAEYTHDESFKTCALYPLNVYRPYVGIEGKIPGWRNFATGLRMHFDQTRDVNSKNAVVALLNAAYGANGITTVGMIPEGTSREVAYAIITMLETEKVGQPRHARLAEYVDIALGHLELWFVAGQYVRMAPFMFALTSEALIRYYEVTQDPRILPELKRGADWIWQNAWVAGDRSFCYEYTPTIAQNNCAKGAPDLNLLIVPVFGWIYSQTGDSSYIDKGDQIFIGGVEGAWLDQGKQFNQSYRWSMDYLKWRNQQ
jgi:hypothetical protein